VIAYRAILDASRELVQFVAKPLAAHRRALGTRRGTRLLTCHRQAVYVLAWLRQPTDVANLGRGFGLARATSHRYRDEGLRCWPRRCRTCSRRWSGHKRRKRRI
jgi:hypothetical protein